MAVSGSRAPTIDVLVAPISFIAIFTVSIATIVGTIASDKAYNHCLGVVSNWKSSPNLKHIK